MHQLKQISCVLLILLCTRLAYTFGKFLYFKHETISTTKSLKSIFTIVIEENNTAWIPCHIFQNSMLVYFSCSVVIFVKNKQTFIWNPLIYVFLFISRCKCEVDAFYSVYNTLPIVNGNLLLN